jgi:hypothetical protein
MRQGLQIEERLFRLLAIGLLSAGISACAGKGTEGSCGVAADCGGDPSGNWQVNGFCEYDALSPYRPMSLSEQTQQLQNPSLAPLQPQPTTDGNWCFDLVYSPPDAMHVDGSVKSVNLWHGSPTVQSGTVSFDSAMGSYAVDLNFVQKSVMSHFSQSCIQFAGATPTCAQLATQLTAFYTSNAMGSGGKAAFQNVACVLGVPDGCDCTYDYEVELKDTGAWSQNDNILFESSVSYKYNDQAVASQTPTSTQGVTFCRSGDSLTLTGYEGASLSLAPGLRTLQLKSM